MSFLKPAAAVSATSTTILAAAVLVVVVSTRTALQVVVLRYVIKINLFHHFLYFIYSTRNKIKAIGRKD
jgi:hypothetical protein